MTATTIKIRGSWMTRAYAAIMFISFAVILLNPFADGAEMTVSEEKKV